MISLDEARSFVLSLVEPLAPLSVRVADAAGLVLAEPVVSTELVPPFANSAMDGFAVRAADTVDAPVVLDVVGTLAAGHATDVEVGPGEALRIMTGAPMPPGADAVVMVELTQLVGGGGVQVHSAVPSGNHVRPAGDDMVPGDLALEPGIELTPGALGVLCTLGRTTVSAVPRARVGVISTGDELVDDGSPLAPGQIRDSNRRTLLALVAQAGCDAVDLGLVADDEAAIEAALRDGAARCDAIVTSGGVSMGDYDYVKAVLARIAEMRWMQVAIRPAKPLAAGAITTDDGRDVAVFGLPGNPVSSIVSFELFARPALRTMMGHRVVDRRRVRAVVPDGLARRADGRLVLARVVVTQDESLGFVVSSSGAQGSHHTMAMARADGLALVPDGDGIAPGDVVDVLLLS